MKLAFQLALIDCFDSAVIIPDTGNYLELLWVGGC